MPQDSKPESSMKYKPEPSTTPVISQIVEELVRDQYGYGISWARIYVESVYHKKHSKNTQSMWLRFRHGLGRWLSRLSVKLMSNAG